MWYFHVCMSSWQASIKYSMMNEVKNKISKFQTKKVELWQFSKVFLLLCLLLNLDWDYWAWADIFNVYNLPTENSETIVQGVFRSPRLTTNKFKVNGDETFSAMASYIFLQKILHFNDNLYLATEKRHVSDVICCASSTKDGASTSAHRKVAV